MEYKQVIIIRKDLNMRKGKMCSQAAHASLAVLTSHKLYDGMNNMLVLSEKANIWLENYFTKVVVGVDSEDELKKLYESARSFNMHCSLIQDSGKTEFNGVPTYTAVAIGPDISNKIDVITGHLKLL